jgi:hypothetical protein
MPTKTKTAKTIKSSVPKKPVAKKITAKKLPIRKTNLKVMVYAPDHESFWTTDGQVLNSLTALHEALKTMNKMVYTYHANADRNDFADWVDVVLSDRACAADLRACQTPAAAKTVVSRHLKLYVL